MGGVADWLLGVRGRPAVLPAASSYCSSDKSRKTQSLQDGLSGQLQGAGLIAQCPVTECGAPRTSSMPSASSRAAKRSASPDASKVTTPSTTADTASKLSPFGRERPSTCPAAARCSDQETHGVQHLGTPASEHRACLHRHTALHALPTANLIPDHSQPFSHTQPGAACACSGLCAPWSARSPGAAAPRACAT